VIRDRDSRAELVKTMSQLLRDQGYAATGRAELLTKSGISNGSLYHHFPGGMEELAEAALQASGEEVAAALREAIHEAPSAGEGVVLFLDGAQASVVDGECPGCPVTPTALESAVVSPRLRAVAARCFDQWESIIADQLRADGWPEPSVTRGASAVLALIEGALLLARVSADVSHLESAKRAALALLAAQAPPSKQERTRS
jgi:TetR/AcrR family transcriptional regulator, lmrAB and yxaGH operons repressor